MRSRIAAQRARRYLRLSRVVAPWAFRPACLRLLSPSLALRTASICFWTCRDRSAMRSSVISSSLKITSSRIVRSPVLRASPSRMTFLATSGVREIDLITASLPRSMRRAISTSPRAVSSGTVPISRRYMRTGSLVLSSAPGVRSSSSSSEPFGGSIDRLVVAQVLLVGVDDFDAGAAERIEQVVELVRRGDLGRQHLVDFVVEQVALFLADVDELPDFVVFLFNRHL
jgi:hypothetical protein